MEWITNILFAISNSLLIPVILLLIIFFVWSLIRAGGFYSEFTIRRKYLQKLSPLLDKIGKGEAEVEDFATALPDKDYALVLHYYREVLRYGANADSAEYAISCYENCMTKELITPRLFTKIGPILGLMGTLISMSPALTGLATGDIAGMAYNMQVVFATTVVGLVISAIGLITLLYKQRWYTHDSDNLLYLSRIIQERSYHAAEEQQRKEGE